MNTDNEIKHEICKDCAYRYTCQDAVDSSLSELEEWGCEYKGVMEKPVG